MAPSTRRLTTILASDVVGYSRLMAIDEETTLATLRTYRAVISELVAKHGGRVFNTAGDAILAEFGSAVEAVRCAVSIQEDLAVRNEQLPGESQMWLRIGVNVGDVVAEGNDLFGDGVNVAARLEGLAEKGGICISGGTFEQVRNKLSIAFADIGPQTVKNIPQPIRAFRALLGKVSAAGDGENPEVEDKLQKQADAAPILPLPDKPSIAVLPFENLSGDREQDYFADGITEDIITALSRIRQFFVIARNTVFTYKGRSVDIALVAKELGVRYVLEGSVRKAGNRIRVTAQLIDGGVSKHIWADRYDRDLEDIFAVQDEITQTVVGAIEPALDRAEQERALQKPPDNVDTWVLFQKALWHLRRFEKAANEKAQALLQQCVELDPTFGPAFAALAWTKFVSFISHYAESPEDAIEEGFLAAQRAISIDDRDDFAHRALGLILFAKRNYSLAIEEFRQSLDINPSSALGHHWLAWVHAFDHQPQAAFREQEIADRLSPYDPMKWGFMTVRAYACFNSKDFVQAADWARRAALQSNVGVASHRVLVASLGQLGSTDAAREALNGLIKVEPHCSITSFLKTFPLKHQDDIALWVDGLRKAGVPE